jgi:hypothetical protein
MKIPGAPWFLGCLLLAPPVLGAGAGAAVRTPFGALEADLRSEVARTSAAWRKAPAAGRSSLEATLKSAFDGLHDIRHFAAFGELWNRWSFAGKTLEVLYPASGAHLAPLEMVHRGHLREATFTFTEIDAAMIPRLEANLVRLSKLGFYSDLASSLTPLPPRPDERSVPPPRDGNPASLQAWIGDSIRASGKAPPLEATFTFRYRETRVRLRLVLRAHSIAPGSTEYFRGEDLAKADLVVTHDLSFDPREHLAFLRSCIESSLAQERRKPLVVMMENLARHPAHLDLSPFGVRAATLLPYGHAAFVNMPDGTRTETEEGPPLYDGALLLAPELPLWRKLAPSERTALFNLVLLRDQGFDRHNVDLVGGRRVEAPAILDWQGGYAHKDIDGRDLRGQKGFLAPLAGACASAAGHLPDGRLRGWLCSSLDTFRSTLERIATRDCRAAVRAAAAASPNHPFLFDPKTRAQFQSAVSATEAVIRLLQSDGEEARLAVRELDSARRKANACGPPERLGPRVPAVERTRP